MSELIERLWEAHASSQQRVLGSDIFAEAATEITRLQEALTAAEAERDANSHLRDAFDRAVEWKSRAIEAEALLAETRKKALEEAAAINIPWPRTLGEAMLESPHQAVERYRAAIRALAEEVRT